MLMPTEWAYVRIQTALEQSRTLPEDVIAFLNHHIFEARAFELLKQCDNASATDYVFNRWANSVTEYKASVVRANLETFFHLPERQAQSAEKMRAALAHDIAGVRKEAARLLEKLGTLHDIGLLLDLIALPPVRNEDAFERHLLLRVAHTLAGVEHSDETALP